MTGSRLTGFTMAIMASIALVGCVATPVDPRSTPEIASGLSIKQAVNAEKHMVVSANPLASQAGLSILRAGGSAVDAAIATQLVLNVVEPQSSGIGGGGFMLHYASETGAIDAYDGRETAPKAARPDLFLRPDGSQMKFFEAAVGGRAVGVPGLVALLADTHKQHGKLPWKALFEPAIKLAQEGFPVSPRLNKLITRDKFLGVFPETAALFFDTNGKPLAAGALLKNPGLANSLQAVANGGAQAFYEGKIATNIVNAVNGAKRNPGKLTLDDMKSYRVKTRAPLCGPYRNWLVCGIPSPSSGGLATLQILGLLEGVDLKNLSPLSPKAIHLFAEAGRLAFADRNIYVADPDFIPVPETGLIDPSYIKARAKAIDPNKSMGKAEPGLPGLTSMNRYAPGGSDHGSSTTHISVVDGQGNVVSMTTSIENAFGSRLSAGGFLLNNQLTDFSFLPIKDGSPVANSVEGGKRPRSSMAPTLVFDATGKPVLVIGSPGGSRIIGYVTKALIAILDWGLNPQTAVSLPHYQNRNGPTDLESDTALTGTVEALQALGHEIKISPMTSGLHAIGISESKSGARLQGGADPRREGVALGD